MMSAQPARVQFDRFILKDGKWYDCASVDGLRDLQEAEPLGRFSRESLIKIYQEENQVPPRAKKIVEPEIDPFAPDQDTEPGGDAADTDTPPWEVEDTETEVKNTVTETKTEAKKVDEYTGDRLSVTIKQHKGYEAGWIVLKGDTPADVLRTMQDPDFKTLMDWTKRASETFQEGSNPSSGGGNTSQGSSGSQNRSQGRPSQASEHPKGRKEFCEHGEMEFKTGLGKNGKMWGGFDCKVDPKNCRGGRVWDNDFGK